MMESRPASEDETMVSSVYEASLQGRVSTLNNLMQKDPLILTKLSLTTISETPLHVSASLGHLAFTRTLLLQKPKLASELNSHRRSPLHLASAEGHTEIVRELLMAYDNACMVPDQDGRIPLHYAVMRGRVEVVRELVRVRPESMEMLDSGQTAFHLCVKYNQLETLKVLVEVVGEQNEVLNSRDCNSGNTILHLAVMLKQVENISYLLSLAAVRGEANAENQLGFTALDILDYSPGDFTSHQIRCLLMEAGIKSRKNQSENLPIMPAPQSTTPITTFPDEVRRPRIKKWRKKCLNYINYMFRHEDNWLENTRGNLMVVSTVIATMSFQAATAPSDSMMRASPDTAAEFVLLNTISFIISLSVTLLLISGLPLRKFGLWILSISMCINLHVLALSFLTGAIAVVSDSIKSDSQEMMLVIPVYIWVGFVWLVGVFLTIRFFVWVVKLFRRLKRKRLSNATTSPSYNTSIGA